jgi:hypothetical protein
MDHLAHESIEQLAAAILVIGGGLFIALALRARRIRPGTVAPRPARDTGLSSASADRALTGAAASPPVRRSLDLMLAGLSVGAAVIHLVAAPGHYAEIGDLATGFLISAAFQALWARWCLAGPSRTVVALGIVGNLAIVAAWAYTRTIGLPIGEFAGSAEPIGFPDAASVVFEVLIVAGLVARRLGLDLDLSRRAGARSLASIAVVPVVGLVLVLTSLATVAIASGLDHGAPSGMPAGMPAGHEMPTTHVATH